MNEQCFKICIQLDSVILWPLKCFSIPFLTRSWKYYLNREGSSACVLMVTYVFVSRGFIIVFRLKDMRWKRLQLRRLVLTCIVLIFGVFQQEYIVIWRQFIVVICLLQIIVATAEIVLHIIIKISLTRENWNLTHYIHYRFKVTQISDMNVKHRLWLSYNMDKFTYFSIKQLSRILIKSTV